jgi:hypothetical protein
LKSASKLSLVLAWLMAMCLASCAPAKPANIHCYSGSAEDFAGLHKVVFVQLADQYGFPQVSDDMTEALFRSIQVRNLFRIEVVKRTNSACQDLLQPGHGEYTLKQLAELKQAFQCDGLLFGMVNSFQPHPHMQVGLYLCLLDLNNGKVVWSVDHMWDTRDRKTEDRLREYFNTEVGKGLEPIQWRLGLISPLAFEKFVAFEVAQTLPPVAVVRGLGQ